MLMVAVVLALHVFAVTNNKGWPWHLGTGLLIWPSLEGHLTTAALFLGIGCYLLFDAIQIRRKKEDRLAFRALIGFVGGAFVGSGMFLWLHVLLLPDPATFLTAVNMINPASASLLGKLMSHVIRIESLFQWDLTAGLLILAALIYSLWQRTPSSVHWLILFLASHVGYILLLGFTEIHYTIYIMPLWLAPAGFVLTELEVHLTALDRPGWQGLLTLAAATIMVGGALGTVLTQRENRLTSDAQWAPFYDIVRAEVSPDEAILSIATHYAMLPEYTALPSYFAYERNSLMCELNPLF